MSSKPTSSSGRILPDGLNVRPFRPLARFNLGIRDKLAAAWSRAADVARSAVRFLAPSVLGDDLVEEVSHRFVHWAFPAEWKRHGLRAVRLWEYQRAAELSMPSGLDALEIGAGWGFFGLPLSRFTRRYTYNDLNDFWRQPLRPAAEAYARVLGSFRDLPTKLERPVDLIVSISVIEHFTPEDCRAFPTVCHALLRPGGRLVLTTEFNEDSAIADHWAHKRVGFAVFHYDSLVAPLVQAGFRIDKIDLSPRYLDLDLSPRDVPPDGVVLTWRPIALSATRL